MTKIRYTEGSDYFTLNGKRYPQIYQAVEMGTTSIAIYGIHDIKNQLLSSTPINEITVNGSTYATQDSLIKTLLPILYDKITIETGVDLDLPDLTQFYQSLINH